MLGRAAQIKASPPAAQRGRAQNLQRSSQASSRAQERRFQVVRVVPASAVGVQIRSAHTDVSMHFRKKWKRPLILKVLKFVTRPDGRKRVEFEGIGKTEFDYIPDGKEEELMPDNSTFWNRPQWYRSGLEWAADPQNANYTKKVAHIFTVDGKAPPGFFRKMVEVWNIPIKEYNTTGMFYDSILDWTQKYYHQWNRLPSVQEATQQGQGHPLEEDILSSYQRLRIMAREDWKDFWRVHPPLEEWQSPLGNAEPDPHMDPNPKNPIPFLTNAWTMSGSYAEDKLVLIHRRTKRVILGAITNGFTALFGAPPLRDMYYETIHEARFRRERERKELAYPGTINHTLFSTLRSVIPGWNHANAFEYGRRNPVVRVIQEDSDVMARVPERDMVAVPRNIQFYYAFRAIYDEIYAPFGLIKPKDEMEMVIAFHEGRSFEEQSFGVPDRFRRIRNEPRQPRPYFYNFSPEEAFRDEKRLFVDQTALMTDSLESVQQMRTNLSSILRRIKGVESFIAGPDGKRGPLTQEELGKSLERYRHEYPRWREVLWEATIEMREKAAIYWSPRLNNVYTYTWKTLSLVKDVPVMIFNGSLAKDLASAYSLYKDSSYHKYAQRREETRKARQHRAAYMIDYLARGAKTPESAKPFVQDQPQQHEVTPGFSVKNILRNQERTSAASSAPAEGPSQPKAKFHTSALRRMNTERVKRKRVDPYGLAAQTPQPSEVEATTKTLKFGPGELQITSVDKDALGRQRYEDLLKQEIQKLIEEVDERHLDGFLPPELRKYSKTLYHDQLLQLKRTFYEVEKARQFEQFKKAHASDKYTRPLDFLNDWASFQPTPPYLTAAEPLFDAKPAPKPKVTPPPPPPKAANANAKPEEPKLASAWDQAETSLEAEFELPSDFQGVWKVYRRLRQLERAKKFVDRYAGEPDSFKDPSQSDQATYDKSIADSDKEYVPDELDWRKAEELAKKLGRPIPSRKQEHFVISAERPDAPISRMWIEAMMRQLYTKLGVVEPTVDIQSYIPTFIKTKLEYHNFEINRLQLQHIGVNWWDTPMLEIQDMRVLVELKRQKLIEQYKRRDAPVPEFLQNPDFVRSLDMAQASEALRPNGFTKMQKAAELDKNAGLGPAPLAHPVVVTPAERLPSYQGAFITQIGVVFSTIKYRIKQFFESRKPPVGLFSHVPLEFNWADVPEELMTKYKILLQWDKLPPSQMPLEYVEFCWMTKQEQFGFSPVLPKRYEEIVVQDYPDLCLPKEFDAYKEIQKRRAAAELDPYKFCFTGPEPEVPEWEAERKRKREETERRFREQTLTELSPEITSTMDEAQRKKRIDTLVEARMAAESALAQDEQLLEGVTTKVEAGKLASSRAFADSIKGKEYKPARQIQKGVYVEDLDNEGLEEELKFAREAVSIKRKDRKAKRQDVLKESGWNRFFNTKSRNALPLYESFNKEFGTTDFDLRRWKNTLSFQIQMLSAHVLACEFNFDRLTCHPDVMMSWIEWWHHVRSCMKEGWLLDVQPVRTSRLPVMVSVEYKGDKPFMTFEWTTIVEVTYWENWENFKNVDENDNDYWRGRDPPGALSRPLTMHDWVSKPREDGDNDIQLPPADFERMQKQFIAQDPAEEPLDALNSRPADDAPIKAAEEGLTLRKATYVEEVDCSCVISIDAAQESFMYIVAYDIIGELYLPEEDELPSYRKRMDEGLKRRAETGLDKAQPVKYSWADIVNKAYADPDRAAKMLSHRMAAAMANPGFFDKMKGMFKNK